jgi:putative nucleotidyltransferase with HDIG domain
MRVFLNLILILAGFFSCYTEEIYLSVFPPRPGSRIPITIRSQKYFNFDQEKALGGKREMALSEYVPLYTYLPDRAAKAREELETLTKEITTLRGQNGGGTQEFSAYVKARYGVDFSQGTAYKLLRYPDLNNLIDGIVTIEESILQSKIAEDPKPLKEKKTIEVLYPKPSGIVTFPASQVITLEKAREALQAKGQQLFWQVDKGILDPILEITLTTLQPNLKYDQTENDKRIEEIISRYPSKVIAYKPGQVLVPFHKVLTDEDQLLISAYQKESAKDFYGRSPWIFTVILLTVLFYGLFLGETLTDEWWRKEPSYRLFLSLLIMTVIFLKACLLFTPFPIYVLPFTILPLIILLVHQDRISATWTTMAAAVLVSLLSGRTLNVLLFFTFGGIAAILASFNIRKRIHILVPSLVVGGANALVLLTSSLNWGALIAPASAEASSLTRPFSPQLIGDLGWAFLGGLVAGPLAIIFLPLLEVGWQTASTFKLNRYADLEHPLLKDLLTKTPATYQHTMTVAYLAQTVGEAIGSNALLLRIGAYYHDIGKMADPKFFAENQSDGKNPHDDLDPHESARIIIAHVINGERMAKEMKLPEVILDFIPQHHGTRLVEYFYSKAMKDNEGNKVRKEDFQYPGPKPQTVEAAILMLCDAVEAASRSLEAPNREKIEKMVRLLVVKRIADGQFDECHLSTQYLAKIVQTLVDALEASLHSRVVYPWQVKEGAKRKLRKHVSSSPPA